MDPSYLLHEFGPKYFPWVVFFCAIFENDVTFVMAGIYATSLRGLTHQAQPHLWLGLLAGVAGAVCHDSFWFSIGHHRSNWIKTTRAWRKMGPQIEQWAARWGPYELFICRFIPGTRNASQLFWGVQRLPIWQFFLLDATAVCIWGWLLMCVIGYRFSRQAETFIGKVHHKHLGGYLLVAFLITALVYYAVRAFTRHEIVKHGTPPEDPRAD
jgi:membrane protein DedA with SNARE-associated domain